eukprot:351460-Chlamydomonas_euryale.AAC.2
MLDGCQISARRAAQAGRETAMVCTGNCRGLRKKRYSSAYFGMNARGCGLPPHTLGSCSRRCSLRSSVAQLQVSAALFCNETFSTFQPSQKNPVCMTGAQTQLETSPHGGCMIKQEV